MKIICPNTRGWVHDMALDPKAQIYQLLGILVQTFHDPFQIFQ